MDARKKEMRRLFEEIKSMDDSIVLARLCSSSTEGAILFERFQYLYYRQKRIVSILEELYKEICTQKEITK